LSYPAIARECTLNHNLQEVTWSKDQITLFNDLTRKSPMNIKILSQRNGVLEVDLAQLNNSAGAVVTVRERFQLAYRPASIDLSNKKSESSSFQFKNKFVVADLEKQPYFAVTILTADSPTNIYLQILDDQIQPYHQMHSELRPSWKQAFACKIC
jgi:hypothetical protein